MRASIERCITWQAAPTLRPMLLLAVGACRNRKRTAPMRTHSEDFTGRQFGAWTVLGFAGHHRFPGGRLSQLWRCQCGCGTIKSVLKPQLKAGGSNGCSGCANRRRADIHWADKIGKRYGKWTIIQRGLIRCECGHIVGIARANVDGPLRYRRCNHCEPWPQNIPQGIGGHMRKRRLALGLTLREVARRLGVSRQRVHQLETMPDSYWSAEHRKRFEAALKAAQ